MASRSTNTAYASDCGRAFWFAALYRRHIVTQVIQRTEHARLAMIMAKEYNRNGVEYGSSRFAVRHVLIIAIFFAAISADESESYRAPDRPVDPEYFGMHVHHAASGTPWPAVQFASWRLWDSGVAWPQLEPQRGKWDFTLLDRYVRIATERNVEIVLTLGLTPDWASARPDEPSAYGKGNAAEPRVLADWEEYVRAVATRYKGVIHNYEIWNEPNIKADFSGSVAAMLQLSQSAYDVLKAVDATTTVISPSPTTGAGLVWFDDFLKRGGCQHSDVIGYHFYVTPDPPEAMIPLIKKVKSALRARRCESKPLWNTESGWAKPRHFVSDAEAAGYLMRTYLVNWLMGVERTYWYAWDNHNWSTLELTAGAGNQMTAVGASYGVIRHWMLGAVLRSCSREPSGVWICQLDRKKTKSWILWSANGTIQFRVLPSWGVKQVSNWTGDASTPANQLIVSSTPLLLTNSAPWLNSGKVSGYTLMSNLFWITIPV